MSSPIRHVQEVLAAQRMEHVHYAIRDVAVLGDQLAREGNEILHLNIGDPLVFDFHTPSHLIEAVYRAMRDGKNGYAPSLGIDEALGAIRAEAERKGIRNIQDVFITQGVGEAADVCLAALLNPGENVLTPSPDYPLYTAVLAKVGARPNRYALEEARDWEPDLDQLAGSISRDTRALILINPNNPTGAVYSRSTLEAIAEIARRHNLVIFSDEIYDKLILDRDPYYSIAALAPDIPIVTFNGLSKNYLVPGWRVGWGIVSGDPVAVKPYVEAIHKLLRARVCANHPEQFAIRPALEGPQDHLTEMNAKLRARRDLTVKYCNSMPHVSCVRPHGAFYAFPRLDLADSDEDFVKQLLLDKHVLVVHGSGFGQAPGTRHFRIVFLPDEATLTRAYKNIAAFLREHYT